MPVNKQAITEGSTVCSKCGTTFDDCFNGSEDICFPCLEKIQSNPFIGKIIDMMSPSSLTVEGPNGIFPCKVEATLFDGLKVGDSGLVILEEDTQEFRFEPARIFQGKVFSVEDESTVYVEGHNDEGCHACSLIGEAGIWNGTVAVIDNAGLSEAYFFPNDSQN